jgi:hypothetical protein
MSDSGVVLGQVVAGLSANRARAVTAVAGMATGVAVMYAGTNAKSLGSGGGTAGLLLVAIVTAAVATAADPRQLRAAAVLDLMGATRLQRRMVVAVEAVVLGLLSLPLGLAVGGAVAGASGTERPAPAGIVAQVLCLTFGIGVFAGRTRTAVTVLDARGAPPLVSGRRIRVAAVALRVVGGGVLMFLGYLLASHSTSWSDLDFVLWPSIGMMWLGLALIVPLVLDGVGRILHRSPTVAAHLGGSLLLARRRLVVPAMLLGTTGAFAIAVHAILGAGLVEREERRRTEIGERYTFAAGLDSRQMVAGRGFGLFSSTLWGSFIQTEGQPDASFVQIPPEVIDQVRATWPDAAVAPIEYLPFVVGGDPVVPRPTGRVAAVGTPELLTALGLERHAGDLEAGRAVALDPSAVQDGKVELVRRDDGTSVEFRSVNAVVADPHRVPVRLPAALVPAQDVADWDSTSRAAAPVAVAVRLPEPVTDADVARLAGVAQSDSDIPSFGVQAWAGGEIERHPFNDGRLDGSGTVALREPGEVRLALLVIAAVAVIGLLVALRLAAVTRRADEEVIELVGARPATMRRVAAYQAGVLTALATSLGLALGIVVTRWGVSRYNTDGRFGSGTGGTDLPPIPMIVPRELLVALVIVPLAAASAAWILALRRPRPSPTSVSDGLLW